jgi:hypothetical protein
MWQHSTCGFNELKEISKSCDQLLDSREGVYEFGQLVTAPVHEQVLTVVAVALCQLLQL